MVRYKGRRLSLYYYGTSERSRCDAGDDFAVSGRGLMGVSLTFYVNKEI